jgi:hypothetical protein
MTEFKKDPGVSCVKIDKMFQNSGNRYLGPLLRVYFFIEVFRFEIKYKR